MWFHLVGGPAPERLQVGVVSPEYFDVLGVQPIEGRLFTPADDHLDSEPVLLLSEPYWRRAFNGDRGLIGRTLSLNDTAHRVVGILPSLPAYPDANDVYMPTMACPFRREAEASPSRNARMSVLFGALKPSVSVDAARRDIAMVAASMASAHPDDYAMTPGFGAGVSPLEAKVAGPAQPLVLLFGIVLAVLAIVCANVGSLTLARLLGRDREIAMRVKLGASRGRLVRQFVTESVLLSTAGGALGLCGVATSLSLIRTAAARFSPRAVEIALHPAVVAFAAAAALVAGLTSGVVPALVLGRRGEWRQPAQRTGAARRRHAFTAREVLVGAQVGLTVVLLLTAGVMLRSVARLEQVDPGFRPEKLLVMRIDLHVGRTTDQQIAYFRDAIERVEALPGVRSAGAIEGFLRSDPEDTVIIEGRTPQHPGPCQDAITGRYFETAGIPLKKGRYFTDIDRRGSLPVAIVNETMARSYWPGEDPIGKRFRFSNSDASPWLTVVGVTGDMHRQGLEKPVAPQAFLPHAQQTDDMMEVIVRTSADPQTMAAVVQSEIQSMDKSVARFAVATVEQQLAEQTAGRRFQTSLIGLFSVVALLLAAIGIYGLMHYLVVQRTNEIGVRMALGARAVNVLVLVLRQGLTLAALGIVVGILGALGLTHLLSSLLYGTTPTDPLTFASAPTILLAVAALACWIPARRAARIDPMLALRQD